MLPAAATQMRQAATVQIRRAAVGPAWQNRDASTQMGRFLEDVSMCKRIHSALGSLTPGEFESQWLAQPVIPAAVH